MEYSLVLHRKTNQLYCQRLFSMSDGRIHRNREAAEAPGQFLGGVRQERGRTTRPQGRQQHRCHPMPPGG